MHRHLRRHALPKKTFEAAAAAKAHLIVQIKDNQPTLCEKVEAACAVAEPLSTAKTVDAKLNEGVLTVTLNKREETKPRKIQVS